MPAVENDTSSSGRSYYDYDMLDVEGFAGGPGMRDYDYDAKSFARGLDSHGFDFGTTDSELGDPFEFELDNSKPFTFDLPTFDSERLFQTDDSFMSGSDDPLSFGSRLFEPGSNPLGPFSETERGVDWLLGRAPQGWTRASTQLDLMQWHRIPITVVDDVSPTFVAKAVKSLTWGVADDEGLAVWFDEIKIGTTMQSLYHSEMSSDEYANLVEEHGGARESSIHNNRDWWDGSERTDSLLFAEKFQSPITGALTEIPDHLLFPEDPFRTDNGPPADR